ncbi:MAG: hypothetical protein WBA59_05890 [Moheibacter sp.]
MKKFILLCSFALLGNFALANKNVEKTKNVEKSKSESVLKGECCTATVWYNGQPVQSYTICGTENNCGLALALAQAYVCAHGGPCE